jgi:uncharacterized protein
MSGIDLRRYGPWAVVAGGSEGLGSSFAEQLAEGGMNLILVGRNPESLALTADRVRSKSVEVRSLALDLLAPEMVQRIQEVSADVEVGLLIVNAGANNYASVFVESDLDEVVPVVELNTVTRLRLAHHFGQGMMCRRRGGMVFVGSIGGYRGSPWNGYYSAAKAFGRIFSEGLWFEMRPFGVDVVEFVVGAMRTPAMIRRGMIMGPHVADPKIVAMEGLAHIGDGPVWTSEIAGGRSVAERLTGFPRAPIIAEAYEGLKANGMYDFPPLLGEHSIDP